MIVMEKRRQQRNRDDESGGRGRSDEQRKFSRPRPPRKAARPQQKKERTKFDVKLFNRWDSNVEVQDASLRGYINLEPRILPRSAGVHRGRFHKSKMHIVERLALKLMVSGHTGKKHKLTSGKFGGAYMNVLAVVEEALAIIEKKENKNPIEVLVRAIENSCVREEVISYQLGSIMAREAVITAPQRRVDKTLRLFSQIAYRSAFNKRKGVSHALADEILAAYRGSSDSFAMKEKDRVEREAMGSR